MTAPERNFMRHATPGTCSVCGEWALVIDDIVSLRRRCLGCCIREQAAREEQEWQKKRIPLDLKGFAEL